MQRCEFCGSEQPIYAHYCGNCGHMLGDRTRGIAHPQTPPLFSNPSHSITATAGTGQEHMDSTVQSGWPEWGTMQSSQQFPGRQPGDRRDALSDMLLPGLLLGQTQVPPAGQVPVVQGTPQVSGVPFVQGTPPLAGSPASSAGQGFAHGAASSMSPQAPTWEPQIPHHDPLQHPQPTPPPHAPHHHHHSGPLHTHKEHVPRHHGTTAGATTKLAVGTTTKWLMVGLTALIVIATGGILLVLASSPGLSLSGSNVVSTGSTLHLHGQGFLPGGSVTLTLDNSVPVAPTGQAAGNTTHAAGSSLLLVAGEEQQAAGNTSISVSVTGAFDANVIVPASWSPGTHTIRAAENLGSRSANLHFTIVPTPAKLIVKPITLNFGPLQVGGKAVLPVAVSNAGQAGLNWSALVDSAATKWLTLQNSSGTIDFQGSNQFINVTANASNLKAGSYHTIIFIYSNGGDAQVLVNLNVVSKSVKKQAHLGVTPQSLDFGQLLANQQVTQGISISNPGELPLTWKADTGGSSWLTLGTTNGTVQPGGQPQAIQVTANTTALAAGSYSGTVNITSNAGNATVTVTLVVTGVTPVPTPRPTPSPTRSPGTTPSPSPSPSPSPTVPIWSASPVSLDSSTCGVTAPCTVTLMEAASSSGNITWTASSNVGTTTFTPPGSTLSPGVPQSVSISGMACKNGTFTFTASGAAKPQALTVPWSCTPSKITVTPNNLDQTSSTCMPNSDGTYTCTVTVGETSPGTLNWSSLVGIGGTGTSINPSSGTLTASNPQQQVTISSIPCQNDSFTFTDQNNITVTVQWHCTPPKLTATGGGTCSQDSSGNFVCSATVALVPGSQGDLVWTSSSDLAGVTLSPSGGTLVPGQPVPVTITVPSSDCPAGGTVTFSGQGSNSVTLKFTCN